MVVGVGWWWLTCLARFERKDRHTQMKDERGEEEMDMEQEVRKLHAKLQLADYKMKPIARTEAQLEADRVRYLEKKEARRRDV